MYDILCNITDVNLKTKKNFLEMSGISFSFTVRFALLFIIFKSN